MGVVREHERGEYVLHNRLVDFAHLTVLRERVFGRIGGLLGISGLLMLLLVLLTLLLLLLLVFGIDVGGEDNF